MTTIAWDGEFLAADGQVTSDGLILFTDYKKIRKVFNCWVTFAGDLESFELFINWFQGDRVVTPALDSDFVAIVAAKESICQFYSKLVPVPVPTPYAWGSGDSLALAAMEHGASARDAVKYAMTRDIYSSGKIQVVKIG